MEKILTIIVPSYNAEKYLKKGLDSFLAAGVFPELEVLIINDGSTDRTEELAGEYEAARPEIFRVITKENGGHGSGINRGAKEAKGKYFKVIDADDWVLSENLAAFLEILKTTSADLVLTNFHEVDMNTGAQTEWAMKEPGDFYGKVYPFEEIASRWNTLEPVFQFHGITYRTEFYRDLHYDVLEHVFYEDQEYSTYPFAHAETVLPCDLFFYEYMVGNADQSISDANRVKRLWMLEKVINRLLEGLKESSVPEGLKESSAPEDLKKSEAPEVQNASNTTEKKTVSLTPARRSYYCRKVEGLVIDYYMISCILDPDRKGGSKKAAAFRDHLKAAAPEIDAATGKQYQIFQLASALRLSPETYKRLLQSKLYKKLRG